MGRTLVLVVLFSCGWQVDPSLPVTPCGMHIDVPTDFPVPPPEERTFTHLLDLDSARYAERLVAEEFKKSTDARLHDACAAVHNFTVQLRERVPDPRPGSSWLDEVNGYCDCWSGIIVVNNFLYLPHEMAHAAQRCDSRSEFHVDWETEVRPQLRSIRDRIDWDHWLSARP